MRRPDREIYKRARISKEVMGLSKTELEIAEKEFQKYVDKIANDLTMSIEEEYEKSRTSN